MKLNRLLYRGLTWEQAQAASRKPLTIHDLDEIIAALPRGECEVEETIGARWPGKLHLLKQNGHTISYLHLMKRKIKQGRIWNLFAIPIDVLTMVTTPLKFLLYGGMSDGTREYDVFLHDANGRLLLWAKGLDQREPFFNVEFYLPDGSMVAKAGSGDKRGEVVIRGVGDLSPLEIVTYKTLIYWSTFGNDNPPTWKNRDGVTVTSCYRHSLHCTFNFTPENPMVLLGVTGAMWWKREDYQASG